MASHQDDNPDIAIRRAAMNLLARREQSFVELTQKLCQRFPDFDPDTLIAPAVEKLRQENLQSDDRFVESYVRYRRSRGVGPLKIKAELSQKGVDEDLVRDRLYGDDVDWCDCCRDALQKKFPHPAVDRRDQEIRYRFLSQRGFSGEQIRSVLGDWQ